MACDTGAFSHFSQSRHCYSTQLDAPADLRLTVSLVIYQCSQIYVYHFEFTNALRVREVIMFPVDYHDFCFGVIYAESVFSTKVLKSI